MYLLDTNVISALRQADRNPVVLRWMTPMRAADLWLSVFTVAELEKGIAQVRDPGDAQKLRDWVNAILTSFEGRVIAFGTAEARRWGSLVGPLEQQGRTPPVVDSQIAAIALEHGLSVVTRNVKDFERFVVPVINPWDDENGG